MATARKVFADGLATMLLGVARALRGTARLRDDEERMGHALALRGIAIVLVEEAARLEQPHDRGDDDRARAIRAGLLDTVRRPRVIQ